MDFQAVGLSPNSEELAPQPDLKQLTDSAAGLLWRPRQHTAQAGPHTPSASSRSPTTVGFISVTKQANKETIPCFNCAPKPGTRVPGASCERPPSALGSPATAPQRPAGWRPKALSGFSASIWLTALPEDSLAHSDLTWQVDFLLLFHFLTSMLQLCY